MHSFDDARQDLTVSNQEDIRMYPGRDRAAHAYGRGRIPRLIADGRPVDIELRVLRCYRRTRRGVRARGRWCRARSLNRKNSPLMLILLTYEIQSDEKCVACI